MRRGEELSDTRSRARDSGGYPQVVEALPLWGTLRGVHRLSEPEVSLYLERVEPQAEEVAQALEGLRPLDSVSSNKGECGGRRLESEADFNRGVFLDHWAGLPSGGVLSLRDRDRSRWGHDPTNDLSGATNLDGVDHARTTIIPVFTEDASGCRAGQGGALLNP